MCCLNNMLNLKVDNVFDFLGCKLAFACGESYCYVTHRGDFIINGEPYGRDWEQWVYMFGLENEYGIKETYSCPDETKEIIINDYKEDKAEWMSKAGVDFDELLTLDLLHKQYLAIVDYSKNDQDMDAIGTIIATYKLTGINCLRYLSELKTTNEWLDACESQSIQIGALFTGKVNPNKVADNVRDHLLKMHEQLNYYINQIDEMYLNYDKSCKEKKHVL